MSDTRRKPWRQNHATFAGLEDTVVRSPSRPGDEKLTEAETVARYPDLVVASLIANRKNKPNGVVSLRVIRDQERSPIASELKRSMRSPLSQSQQT